MQICSEVSCAKLLKDRQTDKQRRKHNFPGGGNITIMTCFSFSEIYICSRIRLLSTIVRGYKLYLNDTNYIIFELGVFVIVLLQSL